MEENHPRWRPLTGQAERKRRRSRTGAAENLNNLTNTFTIEINSTGAYLDLTETCVVAKIKAHIAENKNITLENIFFHVCLDK